MTNKILNVRGLLSIDYSCDENVNLLHDDVNDVWDMKYDFRNLLLSCTASQPDFDDPENTSIYHTEYFYDEAGNRVNKTSWKYSGTDNQPHYPTGTWSFASAQFYVRNISGGEVAVYAGYDDLSFWNIWGSDNVGRIKGNGDKEFYIKDHLGSIRCVVDASSNILSSQDFDAWGHKINGRSYVGDKPSKYLFTSKERDLESDYDYFGARYYDSRIGRWGGTDKFLEIDISNCGYVYCANNSLIFIDAKGLWKKYYKDGKEVGKEEGDNFWDTWFSNTYYVQNNEGNYTYNGEQYFEALSEATVTQTEWNNVVSDWSTSKNGFNEKVRNGLDKFYEYPFDYADETDYVKKESPAGKSLDQKRFLDLKSLYIFNGIALNYFEAGNVVWGAALNRLDIWYIKARIGAEWYSIKKNNSLDQPNEVQAYYIGYYNLNSESDEFKKRIKF